MRFALLRSWGHALDKYSTMWTQWNTASTAAQLEQDQIAYTNPSNLLLSARDLTSTKPLLGLHLGVRSLLIQDSNMLLFSGFNFQLDSDAVVQGVEVKLHCQRLSRIEDKTVQLYYQQLRGSNRAAELAEDLQLYGGAGDLWDVDTAVDWSSPQFGVAIDLQPHRTIPSGNRAIIYSVDMRLNIVG